MAIWQSEWWALDKAPLVTEIFMNWDDDDDGRSYTPWWSYVVYPHGDRELE